MWFYIQNLIQFKPKILRCQWHFTYSFPKSVINDKNREYVQCISLVNESKTSSA